LVAQAGGAQKPAAIERFLDDPSMKGASFSLMAKDVKTGKVVYAYDAERELTPASVMKLVSTATALELLGAEHRFVTILEHDGMIVDSILMGNLYIRGGGDPTLGSTLFDPDGNNFAYRWIRELKGRGIRRIRGAVIADESLFDTEGVSMKWSREDLGSYYGAGSYGLSVFDNQYRLHVNAGAAGSMPELVTCVPAMPGLRFHNYITISSSPVDSTYVVGSPFSTERYLYGAVPAGKSDVVLRGDIPDPPLFLAQYFLDVLGSAGIAVEGIATCFRLLWEDNTIPTRKEDRNALAAIYSPTLREIVEVTNKRSQNLYADVLLKTVGLLYRPNPGEVVSSAGKGVHVVRTYWQWQGLDTSSLWMFDGSGLAASDKVTTSFVCDLLTFMATRSQYSAAFTASLPKAGMEGTVAGFLKGTSLQGKAALKSGSMSRVRAYAGYVAKSNKQYAVVMIVNNYSGDGSAIAAKMEKLLLALF
jgi:D-alanyl-D-alanine carboxypeptidase/D-alanyl-D-alanine-endopeptidase (penicillin-binding protein 4)